MENLIHSIITLNNQEKYIVLNQAIYQGNTYYFVAKLAENEQDILNEFKLLELIEESGEKNVRLVTDKKVIELLAKYFQKEEIES